MTYYKHGNIEMNIAWGLAIGSMIGSFFGATTASLVPEFYLRVGFASFGLWTSMRYIRA